MRTWEEKIENLVRLAKAVGRYTNAEKDTDYYHDARRRLLDEYAEFCEWRHDEPYVIDHTHCGNDAKMKGIRMK